ncbi:MAG: glycosyltransferase family 2 protein [Ignavibacteria bacterium]|nr:glycosyltransferase family 2 protein [Ignavibacteria bacterium]
MAIDIIIVNYNVQDQLSKCVDSIKRKISNSSIIIVDNNSPDRSIENISQKFPEVKFYPLSSNLGFAKANNIGAKLSDSEYLCFLNPDTIVTEDFISPIVNFINKDPQVGVCAPMLVYEDGSYQSSSGFKMGVWYDFLEASYLIGLIRKSKKQKHLKIEKSMLPVEVGWVSGACMILKRSVFEQVGGFSEDYFLNYEDIDLCRKIEDAGYNNYYFPSYKCTHLDHKSFDKNYELLVLSRYQSRLIYAWLHYNFLQRIVSRFLHINGIIIRLFAVNIFYAGSERRSRLSGYFKALFLYLNPNSQ